MQTLDVVQAYVASCRTAGLKTGLYFSILDLRANIHKFCDIQDKIDMIKAQLGELLTDYGAIDLLVFDGWHTPWSRITYDDIPFHDIYRHEKTLQPTCLVIDLNASGFPGSVLYFTDIKAFESNAGQALPDDRTIPAQCCHTLTDGWFWKQGDDARPWKPAAHVVHEWLCRNTPASATCSSTRLRIGMRGLPRL